MSTLVNAKKICEEFGLTLKVVTSTKSFETYNPFFNISGEKEEYCRRVVVITPFEELEEVDEVDPSKGLENHVIIDGNLWLETYELLTPPSKINLDNIMVERELVKKLQYKKEEN